MQELTIEQARQRAMLGLATEGYRIVKLSLEDRLIAKLRENTAFATHWQYQLLVNMESDTSALVYSDKDRNQYRVSFELDAFDEPRITKITPLGPLATNQVAIREQVVMRMGLDLPVTEKQLGELKQLNEKDEKAAEHKVQLEQLRSRRLVGLITDSEYHEQRDDLLLEQHEENNGKKPLFEDGEDGPTKRRKIWEAQQRGELSLDDCLNQCAEIRLAEERGDRRRLLTEQTCAPSCDCADCNLADCREQLDEALRTGLLDKAAADAMWEHRLAMDD